MDGERVPVINFDRYYETVRSLFDRTFERDGQAEG